MTADDGFIVHFRLQSGVVGVMQSTAADWGPPIVITRVTGSHGTAWIEGVGAKRQGGRSRRRAHDRRGRRSPHGPAAAIAAGRAAHRVRPHDRPRPRPRPVHMSRENGSVTSSSAARWPRIRARPPSPTASRAWRSSTRSSVLPPSTSGSRSMRPSDSALLLAPRSSDEYAPLPRRPIDEHALAILDRSSAGSFASRCGTAATFARDRRSARRRVLRRARRSRTRTRRC